MKILATKQPLAPLPNILVGLMKHYFFCAFLSLLLASCGGGGGGSDSGASSKKKAKLCKPLIANGKGEIPWDKKTKKHSTTCTVISCDAGYDNDVDSTKCQQTASGFYSLAKDKTRKTCPTTIPSHSLNNTITGLKLETDCWKCESGSLKNTKQKKCTLPTKGKYYNAQGKLQNCKPVESTPSGGFTFSPNTGAVSTPKGCSFSCKSGYVKSVSGYSCTQGETCDITNGDGFKQNPSDSCQVIDCNTGYVKNTGANSCDIPDLGKYADNVGREQDCDGPTGDTGGFDAFAVNTGAVSAADGCGFSCNTGYVKDTSARECNFPALGKYVNNLGAESPCNSITTEGTAVATRIVGAASTATTCPFSCSAGYLKDASARECNYPNQGTYVNASGAEVGCTDISGITGFGSWLDGAATDEDSCPFSCASGYTISGRTCRRPEMLALGRDTSHVLFNNGEVEAWGSVSDHTWRTHIKENLGGNTPQALVSGDYHQCIILENAGQDHGSLMCWGKNGDGQLGVGDTINKTTPTAVTVLGNDGDGDPYTVKSVAAGGAHTCAILNDDTVKCWGNNGNGQIGGGSVGASKIIIGTAGNPLSGTASRISTGAYHTCAVLTTDNSVQCWGQNGLGQAGGGNPSLGVNRTATEIAAGGAFSCAILDDGSVVCWGLTSTPPSSLGRKTAIGIAVGFDHACALLNDKTVKCWGGGATDGQSGGGTAGSGRVLRGSQHDPLGGQTATQIATAFYYSCAIMESDNSVKCWGQNRGSSGSYGQIVGGVAMTGGTNGTGTSTGETATLTTASTPTATSLDSDANGKGCALVFTGGTLGSPWVAKNYTTPLTYNTGGSTAITDAIDNLIMAIGSPVNIAGTNVTLSKTGTDKIAATTNTAVFEGMTLTIFHDDDGDDCTSTPVGTPITLSGASGGVKAKGLWVISHDFAGSGDTTINLDSVHLDLGNTALSKEDIADKIVTKVTDGSWAGKQYKDLPYLATKLDGSSNANDDCPTNDFCVVFNRVLKGTEGNYGIPFGDRDYEEAVSMTGGSDGTGTSRGETQTLAASSTPTAIALEEDAGGKICKITLFGGTFSSNWIVKDYTTSPLTYNTGGGTNISTAIDNMIAEIGSTVNVVGTTNVTLSKSGTNKIEANVNNAILDGMSLTIYHHDNGGDCTNLPVSTPITLSGASGAAQAEGLWVISNDFISGSGDKTINLDSVDIDLGNADLSKEDIADKIVGEVTGGSWTGTQYEDLPYTATKVDSSDNSDCPSSDYCVEFTRVFAGSEGNDGIPFRDRDYSH